MSAQELQFKIAALEEQVQRMQARQDEPVTEIQLIGCEHSLYTGVVRAYLVQKRIPFEELVATDEIYEKVIIPQAGRSMIPVIIDVKAGGVVVQDSSDIIEYLDKRLQEQKL